MLFICLPKKKEMAFCVFIDALVAVFVVGAVFVRVRGRTPHNGTANGA